MSLIANFSIRQRLVYILIALGLGMAALSLSGFISNKAAVHRTSAIIEDRVKPLQQLKVISDLYAVNIVDTAHKARSGELTYAQALTALAEAETGIAAHLEAYRATQMTEEEDRLNQQVDSLLPAANAAVARLHEILESGDSAGLDLFVTGQLYGAIDPLTAQISRLVDLQIRVAVEAGVAAERASQLAILVMSVTALAGAGLLVFAGYVVIQQVTTPLDRMTIRDGSTRRG